MNCTIQYKDNVTQTGNTFTRAIAAKGSYNFGTHPTFSPAADNPGIGNEGSAKVTCTGVVVSVVVETVIGVPGAYEGFGQ